MITDGYSIKLHGDRWENIGMLINKWHKKFPADSKQLKQDITDARADYKMGAHERPLRKGLLIDPRLMLFIQKFYPDFLSTNNDLRAFADRFPQFVVDEGVMSAKK